MSTPTTHFATLAAAIESADSEVTAQAFGEMAEELRALAAMAPSEELWRFVGALHEDFYSKARELKGEGR
jgi:hypothetical protein